MDINWITNGRKFTPSYTLGVEQFMEFVKQRSPEHAHISRPCTRCLNQSGRAQVVVHDHLLLFGMSATYTKWTHHGESAIDANVEFTEQAHPHKYEGIWESHHYNGIHVSEEPNVGDQAIPDLEMLSELYAAAEEDGQFLILLEC